MGDILVNFVTSNSGGVVEFKKNVVEALDSLAADFDGEIYVLCAVGELGIFSDSQLSRVNIIEYSGSISSSFDKIRLYERELRKIVARLSVSVVINYGDIPARVNVKQIFYFDWPYAVYNDPALWLRMRLKDVMGKALKRIYFSLVSRRVSHFIVQTETIKGRLLKAIPRAQISVVDVGFNTREVVANSWGESIAEIPEFIYPTAIYPHKNLGVLIETAVKLRDLGRKCRFVLTFDESVGSREAEFVNAVARSGVSEYFEFCGRLSREHLLERISGAAAIIMPTLIETYGLPYLEAQVLGKAMLTSDRDFARELCGDSALYFDPLNPRDIASVIINVLDEPEILGALSCEASKRMRGRIDWKESVSRVLSHANS